MFERFLVVCATRKDRFVTNSVASSIVSRTLPLAQSIIRCGFRISIQRSTVSRVPPSGTPFEITSVPSESATFRAVRSAYPAFASSTTGKCFGISPSSANRPAGHHPPHSTSNASAASSAPRSTPVCPPEMIFKNSSSEIPFFCRAFNPQTNHGIEQDAKPIATKETAPFPCAVFASVHGIGSLPNDTLVFRAFDAGNHAPRLRSESSMAAPSIDCAVPYPSSTCRDSLPRPCGLLAK